MSKKMGIHSITFILLIVGGLNWLLVGLFQQDIGSWLFGGMSHMVMRIVYVLVGLSAIYELAMHKNYCKNCEGMKKEEMTHSGGSTMGGPSQI